MLHEGVRRGDKRVKAHTLGVDYARAYRVCNALRVLPDALQASDVLNISHLRVAG